jgi:hypothetical protein
MVDTKTIPLAFLLPERSSIAFQMRTESPITDNASIGHMTGPPARNIWTSFCIFNPDEFYFTLF